MKIYFFDNQKLYINYIMNLTDISKRYGTDKVSHGFINIYEYLIKFGFNLFGILNV